MSVAGEYAVVTSTPLGEQRGTFTIVVEGATFSGRVANDQGAMEVERGRIDGDRLTWTMQMSSPMRLTLDCEATVDGDSIAGTVKAGVFGKMKLTGTRLA